MPSDKLTPGWLARDLEKAEARVKYLNGAPDDALVEAVEWAIAVYFSGNRMPHMSGDPRARLLPHQRRDMQDAARAAIAAIRAHDAAEWVMAPKKLLRQLVQHAWAADYHDDWIGSGVRGEACQSGEALLAAAQEAGDDPR